MKRFLSAPAVYIAWAVFAGIATGGVASGAAVATALAVLSIFNWA